LSTAASGDLFTPRPSTTPRRQGNILLTGEQGSAKTSILNAFTGRYNPEERLYMKSNFSATTTPQIFQKTIETSVDKRMGSTYGPPVGKTMSIFIDDLNQPEVSDWGDQVRRNGRKFIYRLVSSDHQ
jgi:dynein heavy chain